MTSGQGEGSETVLANLAALGKVPVQTIKLSRGSSGLGFNIKGGTDVPFIDAEPGIFVCKIRDKGAAIKDGRLKEGDMILEINGVEIAQVTHNEAVKHFINAQDEVVLKVVPGAERLIKERLGRQRIKRSRQKAELANKEHASSTLGLLVAGASIVAAVAVGAFFIMRYKNQQ